MHVSYIYVLYVYMYNVYLQHVLLNLEQMKRVISNKDNFNVFKCTMVRAERRARSNKKKKNVLSHGN